MHDAIHYLFTQQKILAWMSVIDLTSICFIPRTKASDRLIPSKARLFAFWPSQPYNKKGWLMPVFFVLVAGPGIEPGSGGYEPPEVPLLHPAMYLFFTSLGTKVLPLLISTRSVHLIASLFVPSRLAGKLLRKFPKLSHPAMFHTVTKVTSG